MKAIILAAGRGSRMKEKTEILPKCLTELWGKSLLEWQIMALKTAGINEIGIVTGYHSDEIRKKEPDLQYFHNEAWSKTNMVATLMKAEKWLKQDTCIVSYSDIVYGPCAISALMGTTEDISVIYYTEFLDLWKARFENPLEDIETFRLNGKWLAEIGQKAESLEEIEGQYMGLLKFTSAGWKTVKGKICQGTPKSVEKIDMTGLLSHLLSQGMKIETVSYDGVWLEVDSVEDLELYQKRERQQLENLEGELCIHVNDTF